jgi:siroheme synthase-like protein
MQLRNSIEPFVEPLSAPRDHRGWTWVAAAVLAFAFVGLWADLARLGMLAGLPGPFDAGVQWLAYALTLVIGLAIGHAWSRQGSRDSKGSRGSMGSRGSRGSKGSRGSRGSRGSESDRADAELARLPVFLGFEGRRVVVVGGGRVAAAKIPALLAAGADVTVVAPEISPLIDRSRVRIVERAFVPEDLDGAWFVTAAANSNVNRTVHEAAEARHIFVNAVDDPRHATAYLGGTIARDGVTIAVSTSGKAPALAGLLREAIDDMLPSELGSWVERARELSRQQRANGVAMERRRPELLEALNRLYDKPEGLSPQELWPRRGEPATSHGGGETATPPSGGDKPSGLSIHEELTR